MKKLKVVTVVGTRPEIIRLSRLIPKLDQYTDHVLVHTGQNSDRQLNEVFFEDLELRPPDYYLNVDTSSMGSVMGDVLKKAEEVFIKEKPDAVMILGDTNSAIAAVVAERMHIPVYHMEAGNRSFDANVPEELNRKMVDHVATFNLPYSDYSMRNLLTEGIHPRFIHKTGSPVREIFAHFQSKIEESRILESLGLVEQGYFVASIHRQENVDAPERLAKVLESLDRVSDDFGLPIVVSTHPRTRKKLASLAPAKRKNITFHEPFGFLDYNKLQIRAKCVISDSGTIAEESSIIGFPAVTLRDAIERPEAVDAGSIIMVSPGSGQISDAINLSLSLDRAAMPDGYEVTNFSDRVISFLFSTYDAKVKWQGVRKV